MKTQTEQNVNYNRLQDQILKKLAGEGKRPRVLVHSCCAPCSTYVLEKLTEYMDVTIYFYNPNIHPKVEYERREHVQQEFIAAFNAKTDNAVEFLSATYQPKEFFAVTKGLENEKEGGARCAVCYELRMHEVAEKADELGYDYFTSALTLSPKKNSQTINKIGLALEEQFETQYLPSDFKKQNGYKRSIEMCQEYNVYRQCYCGCVFAAKDQGVDFKEIIKNAKDYKRNIALKESE